MHHFSGGESSMQDHPYMRLPFCDVCASMVAVMRTHPCDYTVFKLPASFIAQPQRSQRPKHKVAPQTSASVPKVKPSFRVWICQTVTASIYADYRMSVCFIDKHAEVKEAAVT